MNPSSDPRKHQRLSLLRARFQCQYLGLCAQECHRAPDSDCHDIASFDKLAGRAALWKICSNFVVSSRLGVSFCRVLLVENIHRSLKAKKKSLRWLIYVRSQRAFAQPRTRGRLGYQNALARRQACGDLLGPQSTSPRLVADGWRRIASLQMKGFSPIEGSFIHILDATGAFRQTTRSTSMEWLGVCQENAMALWTAFSLGSYIIRKIIFTRSNF